MTTYEKAAWNLTAQPERPLEHNGVLNSGSVSGTFRFISMTLMPTSAKPHDLKSIASSILARTALPASWRPTTKSTFSKP